MNKISSKYLSKVNDLLFQKQLTEEWQKAYGSLRRHEIAKKALAIGGEAMKWLLVLAVIAGTVAVISVAPKIFALFNGDRRMYVNDRDFGRRLSYMRRQRYITIAGESDKLSIRPTKRGKLWLLRNLIKSFGSNENDDKAKDGKMRIVIFDIPRKHNAARDAIRDHLRKMGLEQLQESVYLSRFACEEKVIFLARIWNVSDFISIIRADSIERID